MNLIDVFCRQYKSLLNERIANQIDNNEHNVENFTNGLESTLEVYDNILDSIQEENVYEYLTLLKRIAQHSLNRYLCPILFNQCEILTFNIPKSIKENESLNSNLELLFTKKDYRLKDVKSNIMRYIALFLIIRQMEVSLTENLYRCKNTPHVSDDQENITGVILHTQGPCVLEDKWLCKICTCKNSYEREKCEACENSGPHFLKWRCENCTFFNKRNANCCKACRLRNTNIILCPGCKMHNINQLDYKKSYDKTSCRNCCNPIIDDLSLGLCSICHVTFWACFNETCRTINEINSRYCRGCSAAKSSIFKECVYFKVSINNSEIEMWQCSLKTCYNFNNREIKKCCKCYSKKFNEKLKACSTCGLNYKVSDDKCRFI